MSTYPFCTASGNTNTHNLLACWSTLFVTRPITPARRLLAKKWKLQILLVIMQPALPFVRSKSGRLEHRGIVGQLEQKNMKGKKWARTSKKLSLAQWTNAAFREYQVVNTMRSILNNDRSYADYMQLFQTSMPTDCLFNGTARTKK